jgi:hypothetical protein
MAEGEIESRSNQELPVYKAVFSVPASRPPFGHKSRMVHHGLDQCFPPRSPGWGLMLSADSTANQWHNQARTYLHPILPDYQRFRQAGAAPSQPTKSRFALASHRQRWLHPNDPRSAVGEGSGRHLDCPCRHHLRSVATVYQQSRQNLGTRLYTQGHLANRESKREKLRSAIGSTARFEKDLCAIVSSGRR